eukprot:CAMPEP_0171453532 /NCGR_PEP_ID=MMETSP0945-20130129/1200_1 /TAXON_ID=109269 /ORGANISM="Vaucheria litorea, Strain CCMP2940" /LENGTH=176 /DNA_ID=CAMNT_0011978413 /DNA_START=257 /DNA_END=787 /DNA_ORIENTATION=+
MTRHNIGFVVVDELSKRWGLSFKNQKSFMGLFTSTHIKGKSVGILKPNTYMNNSGESVRKTMDYFKLKAENILVVTDDVALDFGVLRIRSQGSSGGHNGLKSVQSYLKTDSYNRLKIGIGSPKKAELRVHVLNEFSKAEKSEVGFIVNDSVEAVEKWVQEDRMDLVKAFVNSPRNM